MLHPPSPWISSYTLEPFEYLSNVWLYPPIYVITFPVIKEGNRQSLLMEIRSWLDYTDHDQYSIPCPISLTCETVTLDLEVNAISPYFFPEDTSPV